MALASGFSFVLCACSGESAPDTGSEDASAPDGQHVDAHAERVDGSRTRDAVADQTSGDAAPDALPRDAATDSVASEVTVGDRGSPVGDAAVDVTGACATTCNAQTGLCAPLQICTVADACEPTDGTTETSGITLPGCATTATGRPMFDDGPPMQWTDTVNGDARAACAFVPPSASVAAPVPLIVYLHGAQGSADNLYNSTSLRSKAASYSFSGASGPGFAVVALQARNLHWVGDNPPGAHWDEFYRDLGSPSSNPDIRNIDWIIDTMVSQGTIDPSRIYLAGWSNGAFMSQLYGVARLATPTPGGNHVFGVAVYAGGDPFATFDASDPTCAASPYPHSQLPILSIHRNCDALVGCDQAQQSKFSLQPGYDVEDWLSLAATSPGLDDPALDDLIIAGSGASATACLSTSVCSEVIGAANHTRWPDGVSDQSGIDWEPMMLDFLASHAGS